MSIWSFRLQTGFPSPAFSGYTSERPSPTTQASGVFAKPWRKRSSSGTLRNVLGQTRSRGGWINHRRHDSGGSTPTQLPRGDKAGVVPAEWEENKRCHKDTDARWFTKNGENYLGYKNHVKTDAGTVLITKYEVTTANVHDSVPLGKLLEDSDRGQDLHADSAYAGKGIEEMLADYRIQSRICEKGKLNYPLTEIQRTHNRQKSKIRAWVEHVFGFMENSMNGIFLRCIGLKRATCQIGLANMVHNMCRYSQLEEALSNLQEAVEFFLECASSNEIAGRWSGEDMDHTV